MRKAFYGSLCHNGAHGCGIYLDDKGLNVKCQKLTIEEKYKDFRVDYGNIEKCEKRRAALVFPAVEIIIRGGERIKLLIFNRSRFLTSLSI